MNASVAGTIEPAAAASAWQRQLTVLGVAAAAVLLLLWSDAADMAGIWWNSSTYNHCVLIPPLIAWLVWQRRAELADLTPRAWLPGLAIVAAGACAWLLGYAGGISLGRHAGLVVMLQGAVVTLLGKAVTRGLAFPLFFAFFAIPFGSELVPAMQTVTAELAMALLNLSGVPALLEGVFITTPIGYFEVAEACAGVKFLIAMAALGALVANVCFRSWRRRILFLVACIIVPILANGIRAFATIYVAEQSGVEFASGMDHVIYGGAFFALVIALILGIAWRYFDRRVNDPWFDPRQLQPVPPASDSEPRARRVGGLVVLAAAAPLLWATAIAAAGRVEAPSALQLPDVPGWSRIEAVQGRPWQPHFAGADHFRVSHYRDQQGREVTLAIAYFARQEEGRELVGFGQGAVGPGSDWAWTADAPAPANGRAERLASHGELREVVSFYRVGDILTGSGARVKLETMKVRLIGGPQRAVAVLVSAGPQPGGAVAREAIDGFVDALGPVEAFTDRLAAGR
jgi:exosortase A